MTSRDEPEHAEETPSLPRDPEVGYCVSAPLPFIVAPIVLALRGWDLWLVILGGLFAGFGGLLTGALCAFLLLEYSATVRNRLGAVAISLSAVVATLLFALFVPAP